MKSESDGLIAARVIVYALEKAKIEPNSVELRRLAANDQGYIGSLPSGLVSYEELFALANRLLRGNTDLLTPRQYAICVAWIKYRLTTMRLTIESSSIRRRVGNLAKATGIDFERTIAFARRLLLDVVKTELAN